MTEIKGKDIVSRIDSILKKRNLKRKAVADAVGISLQPFTSWSNRGSIPGADIAYHISEYLNVGVDWLLTGKEQTLILSESEIRLVRLWRELSDDDREGIMMLIDFKSNARAEKKIQAGAV